MDVDHYASKGDTTVDESKGETDEVEMQDDGGNGKENTGKG